MVKSENVRVVVRFRPFNDVEKSSNFDPESLKISFSNKNRTVRLKTKDGFTDKSFNFDFCFDENTDQDKFFKIACDPVMQDVLKGFSGTIFAYGQTGSGKTWSMMGPTEEKLRKIHELRGIIPRAGEAIFSHVTKSAKSHTQFDISLQYLEIYKEKVQDLLDPYRINLKIRESPSKGIFVQNLSTVPIKSLDDVYNYVKVGDNHKRMAETNMNKVSSRSHSVFMLKVISKDTISGTTHTGTINLVDLAGSEKVRKSGAKGNRLQEAKAINKSLSALGQCINSIVERKSHIPYRNSKLTRILQNSLGGNSKTTVVCALSPHPYNLDETISTLQFGVRAKSIKLKVKSNILRSAEELQKMVDVLETQLKKVKIENKELLSEISKFRKLSTAEKNSFEKLKNDKNISHDVEYPSDDGSDEWHNMGVSELHMEIKNLKARLVNANDDVEESANAVDEMEREVREVREEINVVNEQKEVLEIEKKQLFIEVNEERSKCGKYEKAIEMYKKRLKDYENDINETENELEALINDNEEMEEKKRKIEEEKRRAESKARKNSFALTMMKVLAETKRKKVQGTVEKLQKCEKALRQKESEIEKLKSEKKIEKEKVEKLKKKLLSDFQRAVKEMEDEEEEKDEEINDLKEIGKMKDEQLKKKDEQISILKKRIVMYERNLKKRDDDIERLMKIGNEKKKEKEEKVEIVVKRKNDLIEELLKENQKMKKEVEKVEKAEMLVKQNEIFENIISLREKLKSYKKKRDDVISNVNLIKEELNVVKKNTEE